MESLFKMFSVGYVAVDKERGSPFIRVVPVETIPQLDGTINEEINSFSYRGFNGDGESVQGNVSITNAIMAEWYGDAGQRVTVPDVVKGETVEIYRYADADRYYWRPNGRKRHLRKEETVTLCVGATPQDKTDTVLNQGNSYQITVSGHDGHITLSTSKANGEKVAYVTKWDPSNGLFTWKDDRGQVIQVNSMTNLIVLQNKQGTSIKLDKSDMMLYAPDSITHEAVNSYTVKCKDYKLEAGQSVKITAGTSIKAEAPDYAINTTNYKLTAKDVTVESAKVTYVCPMSQFQGMITCGGLSVGAGAAMAMSASSEPSCKVMGGMAIDGNVNITDSFDCGGSVNITGTATVGRLVSKGPIDAPNIP